MKKILIVLLLVFSSVVFAEEVKTEPTQYGVLDDVENIVELVSMFDEVNIKVASYVKHHFVIDNLDWNEGFKNSAKGIEGISYLNEHHGVGLSYITFRNSFNVRTNAAGFVYKYTSSEIFKDFKTNMKVYYLFQKGYYGTWDKPLGWSSETDNEFWTPLMSTGVEYKNFTLDIVGTHTTLHAVTFGYSFKL